jgi:hypothetical protein
MILIQIHLFGGNSLTCASASYGATMTWTLRDLSRAAGGNNHCHNPAHQPRREEGGNLTGHLFHHLPRNLDTLMHHDKRPVSVMASILVRSFISLVPVTASCQIFYQSGVRYGVKVVSPLSVFVGERTRRKQSPASWSFCTLSWPWGRRNACALSSWPRLISFSRRAVLFRSVSCCAVAGRSRDGDQT